MNIDRWFHIVKMRLRSLFRRNQVEKELAEEIQYHIEQSMQEKIAKGISADDAKSAAIREIGGVEQQKEECRDTRRMNLIENLMKDLRYALRGLKRSPGFTLAVIFSLTLGIGANAAIFQLLNAVRLKSLPVANPHELIELQIPNKRGFGVNERVTANFSNPLWEQIQNNREPFSEIFAWGSERFTINTGAQSRDVEGIWASGGMFQVLGINPVSGRLISPEDDRRGGGNVVVVSHSFAQQNYGGANNAIGRSLIVWDKVFTVIGVTPPEFYGLEVGNRFDLALPLSSQINWGDELTRKEYFWLSVMGRLKQGWSLEQSTNYLNTIRVPILESTVPTEYDAKGQYTYKAFRFATTYAGHGLSSLRENYETSLWLLLAITSLVLLIACANIANLSLARAISREREIAVRIAIGAPGYRVISRVISESFLLALLGALSGISLAQVLSRFLLFSLSTQEQPIQLDLSIDWRILVFFTGITLSTCLIFALAPAFRSILISPIVAMKSGGRFVNNRRERFSLQRFFIIGQISITLVLLIGAVLFIRSFINLVTVDLGFQSKGVTFVTTSFHKLNLTKEKFLNFQTTLLEQVRSIPDVEVATTTTHMPQNRITWVLGIRVQGEKKEFNQPPQFTYISPEYFNTLEIPLLQGRDFNKFDIETSRRVLIVNETFVKDYLSNRSPLGIRIQTVAEPDYPEINYEIVGIVKDTKYTGIREEPYPIAYVPSMQHPSPRAWSTFIIRSSAPQSNVISQVRRKFDEVNPEIRTSFKSFEESIQTSLVLDRLMACLAGTFGILAILLASIGLYGVISYIGLRRAKEIGIRIALGAKRKSIIGMMLGGVSIMLFIGLMLGTILSLIVSRSVSSLLFGLSPYDVPTLLVSSGLLLIVAMIAGVIPAYRASKINPLISLRNE